MIEATSPFKFLDSYTQADNDIFFGRELEVDEIHAKVFQSKLLLVYGASGTGKSSIINCGLANKFQEADWLPINIRRGGNITKSMFNQIKKQAISQIKQEEKVITQDAILNAINSVYLDHFKPIYLIFDQFEELFIFGMKEEWQTFIKTIKYLMDTELELKFIFIIRGEYLENLSEFEDYIPDFFDNRLRVEKMTRTRALESITGPCSLFSIELEDGFEEKLLKKLSPDKSQVELTFLQVFLDKIYKKAQSDQEGEKIKFENNEIENIGNLGDVLAEFLDEQLFKMNDHKAALVVIKSFVSVQGTKTQNTIEEIVDYSRSIGDALDTTEVTSIVTEFVNRRILKDQDDTLKYELRHDSLAQKVFEKITLQERELLDAKHFLSYSLNEHKKRDFMLNDHDLSYISPHVRILNLNRETLDFIALSKKHSKKRQQTRKTRNIVAFIIVLLLITSMLGLYFIQQERQKSNTMAELAQQESEEAKKQKELAETQKKLAEEKSEEASLQAKIASEEKIRAEQSNLEAQNQRTIALTQKQIAEQQKNRAEQSKQEALSNEEEAQRQKEIADNQRNEANRLKMLSIAKAISVKAIQISDSELTGLLSLQAYKFNNQYGGYPFQPDIYHALYTSRKLNGMTSSIYTNQTLPILAISVEKGEISTLTKSGTYLKLKGNKVIEKTPINNDGQLITSAIILAKNRWIFCGSDEGTVLLFNTNNKQQIFNRSLSSHAIQGLVISDNKKEFVVVDAMGKVSILGPSGSLINEIKLNTRSTDILVHPDSNNIYVATSSGRIIKTNRVSKTEEINTNITSGIESMALNPRNTNEIVVGFTNGSIAILDLKTKELRTTLNGHSAAVSQLEFDANGAFLISSSYDRSVIIWNMQSLQEQPIRLSDHDTWVTSIAFNKSNSKIISGSFNGKMNQFPVNMETLTEGLCNKIKRNLTIKEWTEYIADNIAYEKTCDE